jgi:hypothetical protein
VSKLLPAVTILTFPLVWGVHVYHMDLPPAFPAWLGSPGSLVALLLLPVTVPPLYDRALLKLSLLEGVPPTAFWALTRPLIQ